jgi:hypothetical protein
MPRCEYVRRVRANFLARSTSMLDVILVVGALVFFALSIGYAYACDQL